MKDEPNLSQHVFTEQTSPQWEVWPRVVSLHVRKVGAYTRDWKLKSVQLELVLPLHQTPLKKSDSLVLRKFRTGSCDFHSSHTTLCQK